jgi:putative PEP-CTERM system histidine kinase
VDTYLQPVDAAGLIVGAVLIVVSLARNRLLNVDLYPSQSVLYGSLTVTVVGAYLLVVGVLAKAVSYFGGAQALPLATFVVFLALVGLAVALLSGTLRHWLRRFVSRHFQRPHHDYRREWMDFARRTTSVVDVRALCAAVTRMVSEALAVPSVTIWLLDPQGQGELGASTVFSEAEGRERLKEIGAVLLGAARDLAGPGWVAKEEDAARPLREAGIEWAVPLSSGGELLGVLTLGPRLGEDPFDDEDLDLLKAIADQTAASLHNLRLSDRVLQAKEMEAFQTLSAFFIHDLKNLASKLSLTLQNLPEHYDHPDFRKDLLAVISRSVAKIDEMCTRLSPLSARLELGRAEADLNQVVSAALDGLADALKGRLVTDLRPLPPAELDAEQVHKVLVNLVLNANDSLREGGEIRVSTRERDGWLEVAVADDGCGMSPEFMARSLFKPFHTTKQQGLGIGLFHSKKIVEAHEGRIEVESGEGRGTTFRVMLPGKGTGRAHPAA